MTSTAARRASEYAEYPEITAAPHPVLNKPDRGGRSTVITTHGGDLVVMGGRCQKDFSASPPRQAIAP
jgi:hypothetical protein